MSDDQTSPVKKSNQLPPEPQPRPQLKNSTSSSSASSSSNLPSRQSSGSDIRNDRSASIPDRPPSRSRSARHSLAGTESSMVSSGFGSGFESRRYSVSHGNLPTNSESTIFPLERPRNSSNEIGCGY